MDSEEKTSTLDFGWARINHSDRATRAVCFLTYSIEGSARLYEHDVRSNIPNFYFVLLTEKDA